MHILHISFLYLHDSEVVIVFQVIPLFFITTLHCINAEKKQVNCRCWNKPTRTRKWKFHLHIQIHGDKLIISRQQNLIQLEDIHGGEGLLMFHRHPQHLDNHHPPRNIDRYFFCTNNILTKTTTQYNELAWGLLRCAYSPSRYSLVANPDQDPMSEVGYPRGVVCFHGLFGW